MDRRGFGTVTAGMFRERPLTFVARGVPLAGILHPPRGDGALQGTGIVIVPGGLNRRVGLHRLYTLAARAYADQGAWVLRFDLPGVGESGGEMRRVTSARLASLEADYLEEVRAAQDCLKREAAPQFLFLLGHCNGARSAVAAADRRADGVIAWGMPTGADDGTALAPWMTEALETLLRRRIPALFLYGTKDPAWPHFEAFTTGAGPETRVRMRQTWVVHTIAAANHDFTTADWTREVIDVSTRWMCDRWSRGQG